MACWLITQGHHRKTLPAEVAARVRLRDVTGAGNFDLVTPGTLAFEAVFDEVRRLLKSAIL
ncbi:hypothetical protein [Polaromonas sp.]|uniref:hypothetical protein n=1 Tax=Polaromonas sp. TaxID=1869339 RepID=UPI003265F984